MNLKRIIVEETSLLLEKRIDQITQNVEVVLSMDLIKHKGHVVDRCKAKGRESVEDYDTRPVTNSELKYFVSLFRKDIAEKIDLKKKHNKIPAVKKTDPKQKSNKTSKSSKIVEFDDNYWWVSSNEDY